MATYGLEIEFPSLVWSSIPKSDDGIMPSGDVFIIKYNNSDMFLVQGDMLVNTGRTLEIVSIYPKVGRTPPTVSLYDGMVLFLNRFLSLMHIDHASGCAYYDFPPGENDYDLGSGYTAQRIYKKSLRLRSKLFSPATAINFKDLTMYAVNTQYTFGFDKTTLLWPMLSYFRLFDIRTDMRNKFAIRALDTKRVLPYSEVAKDVFFALLSSQQPSGGVDELIWMHRWLVIEFIRVYLSGGMVNIKTGKKIGNKRYTPIMSRLALRDNIIDFHLSTSEYALVRNYVVGLYTEQPMDMVPFYPLYPNYMIASKKNDDQSINNNLKAKYEKVISVTSILANLFRGPHYETIIAQLSTVMDQQGPSLMDNLEKHKVPDPLQQWATSISNLSNYDILSPLPFSMNSDEMGYFSRSHPYENGSGTHTTQKYLFENRIVDRLMNMLGLPVPRFDETYFDTSIAILTAGYEDWPGEAPPTG